jgi:hypothetical protein
MTIQTTELLELLFEATQLDLSYEVKEDKDGDYEIRFFELYTNDFSETLVIHKDKHTETEKYECKKGTASFYYLLDTFDAMLREKEEEKFKEQKRQELLARLTDEEKKLLGVK